MTISSTDDPRAGPFNGNGSQTVFPFVFKTFAKADLLVVRTDEDGIEYVLVLDSDYSVSLNADQDANPGGSVTYPISGAALPAGETLTITSNLDYIQTTDIQNAGGFFAQVVEDALDRNVMLVKQVNEKVDRALQVSVSTPDDVDVVLPPPSAQKIIGWNDTATGLVNRDITDFATVVAFAAWQSQTFDGDGTTTQFTLSGDPGNINNLDIAIGGVTQTPLIDFTLSGTTLTFTTAPVAGTDNVFARWGQALPQGVTDASQVPVQRTDIDATATALDHWIEGHVVSYKADYGGICNGTTDETAILQAALDDLPAGYALWLSGDINFTSVNFDTYRGSLIGNARMRGTINVTSDGTRGQTSHFVIEGLTFWPTAEDQTVDAITLTNLVYGSIRNNNFIGSRYCVHVPARATQPGFQDVARIEVVGNQYDYANRFIFSEYTGAPGNYGTGDWTITGNRGLALVDHIKGQKWDGGTIADNTFFCLITANVGAPTATELLRRRGIDLTDSPYLTIHDNKVFETGADGILLTGCAYANVHDNTIAYPGSIISGAGIKIAWASSPALDASRIHDNVILRPSTGGIDIGANTIDTSIAGNQVAQPGANDHAIAGPTQTTKGLIVNNTTFRLTVESNYTRNGTFDTPDGTGNTYRDNKYESTADNKVIVFDKARTLTAGGGNPQTTEVSGADRVVYPATVQVDGITDSYTVGFGTRIVRVYFGIGGCVLVHSAGFVLIGAVNANPPNGAFMEFEITEGGATREIFRSF